MNDGTWTATDTPYDQYKETPVELPDPVLCKADLRTWQAAAKAAAGEVSTEMVTLRMGQEELARLIDTTILELADVFDEDLNEHRSAFVGLAVAAVNGYQNVTGDRDALATVVRTIAGKQRDYGHDNIARFGLVGLVVRLNDKGARLLNLIRREADDLTNPAFAEPITDTWLDVAGYALLALMWIDGTFLLPLAEDI